MKNLLGKFHAELSQQSQAKPSLLTTAYLFFICQENFMKNLLGKFHAELSQQVSVCSHFPKVKLIL